MRGIDARTTEVRVDKATLVLQHVELVGVAKHFGPEREHYWNRRRTAASIVARHRPQSDQLGTPKRTLLGGNPVTPNRTLCTEQQPDE